ncbi:MAG: polysaccharide pyruvyl transferase family protein [Planctomycetota bacterium]
MQSTAQDPRLCLFGAAPSTGNLGVSALFHSALAGLFERYPAARVTAFDFGRSAGPLEVRLGDAHYQVERRGANNSKRYWRSDSLANMRLLNRLGGLGNPGVAAIRASRAVWDVSGGDSFTDLYGVKRFWTTTHPKFLAIEAGRPLVLLPQTYGPFQDPGLRKIAEEVTRKAASAWARDERSFEALRELLGSEFDPARHRCGVDMAFGLPTTPPRAGVVPAAVQEWREAGASIVGLNVSGLIYLDPRAAQERYGFRADYGAVMRGLVQALVERDQRVVLVPHVLEPAGNVESDPEACRQLVHDLSPEVRNRVAVLARPTAPPRSNTCSRASNGSAARACTARSVRSLRACPRRRWPTRSSSRACSRPATRPPGWRIRVRSTRPKPSRTSWRASRPVPRANRPWPRLWSRYASRSRNSARAS